MRVRAGSISEVVLLVSMLAVLNGCSNRLQVGEGSIIVEQKTAALEDAIQRLSGDSKSHSHTVRMTWFPWPNEEVVADPTSSTYIADAAIAGPAASFPIDTARMSQINELIHELPESAQNVPQHNAIFISFDQNGSRVTRVYSLTHRPEIVEKLAVLLHANLPAEAATAPTTQIDLSHS